MLKIAVKGYLADETLPTKGYITEMAEKHFLRTRPHSSHAGQLTLASAGKRFSGGWRRTLAQRPGCQAGRGAGGP